MAVSKKKTALKVNSKKKEKSNPVGRPTKYTPEILDDVKKYSKIGLTLDQIAGILEINRDTVYAWKKEHPEFSDVIKNGREAAGGGIVRSMYERATGYEHEEEKIFIVEGEVVRVDTIKHYPPDTGAGIFLARNWTPLTDRVEVKHEVVTKPPFDVSKLTVTELKAFRALMEKAKPEDV